MNIAAALMSAGACGEAVLALLRFHFAQASSWRSTRPFAWVALTASG